VLKLAADVRPHALRSRKRGQFGGLLHNDETLGDGVKQVGLYPPSQRRCLHMIRQCGKQMKNVNTGRKTMAKETVTETRLNAQGQRETGTDLTHEGVTEITVVLRPLLADAFALYFKTKNFHWHMTGQHFRDYHLLLDEHAEQIFAMTDDIAERGRKIGGTTLRSISDISRH